MTNQFMGRYIEVLLHTVPWRYEIDCLLVHHHPGPEGQQRAAYATNVEFQEITDENGHLPLEPTFRLRATQAQQLMDELWKCGLRPSEGTGSAGALAAAEKHLDDMRAIVEKSLDVQLRRARR